MPHPLDGFIPTTKRVDILCHEFMFEVVDVGSDVKKLKRGDRMVLAAFGGGFTWAGAYVQWAYDGAGAPKLNGKGNGKSQ